MLQDIRKNSQGTVAKVIVWAIAVTFALFGVESIVGGIAGEPEVASVNGDGIGESSYMRALEGKRRQILAQMGANADPDLIDDALLNKSVLDGLIEQAVLSQDAEQKDLYVSDQAIDRYIADIEQFKIDGVFSNDRLQALLRSAGLTLQDYRDSLRTEFMIAQPRSALIASSFLLDQERQEVVAMDRQKRSFGSLKVAQDTYIESVVVSDEEIQAYYDEHSSTFVQPESVDVSFVEIKRDDFLSEVEASEDELRQMYENEKQEFQREEERSASHILISIGDDLTEEQALEKIQSIAARIKEGEDFAALAKEFSQDEGSVDQGGSLGAAARGVYVAPFEDALFAMAEGEVSEPVKTEFGYHLIRVDDIIDGAIPEFEELQARLEVRLKDQKAREMYAEMAERLADISYAAPDLEEPSEELSLELKKLSAVSTETADLVFGNIKVQRQLFSDDLVKEGNNSELIEIDEGHGVVVRVDNYTAEGVKAKEEVAEQIRERLVAEKASEFAQSVGQAFMVRVSAGEDAEVVAKDMGLEWTVEEAVERNSANFNAELLAKVFVMSPDEESVVIDGFKATSGDYYVAVLNSVEQGQASELNVLELQSITRILGEGVGAQDYRNYQQIAQANAEVEVF